jgi:hypothetical protein
MVFISLHPTTTDQFHCHSVHSVLYDILNSRIINKCTILRYSTVDLFICWYNQSVSRSVAVSYRFPFLQQIFHIPAHRHPLVQ